MREFDISYVPYEGIRHTWVATGIRRIERKMGSDESR